MGMQTMQVQQPGTPSGKGGFASPQPQNASTLPEKQYSMLTGQPQFGAPNQYATTQWDSAQFGAPTAGSGKGKGGGSQQTYSTQPFIAPTQFPVQQPVSTTPAADTSTNPAVPVDRSQEVYGSN